VNKFVFEADPPNTSRIPATEIIGVTVILLTCSYDEREFVRVGYYVNNEYMDEALAEDPPAKPVIEKVRRNILAEKPRVTRFAIKWDSEESAPAEFPPEQPEVDLQEDDEAKYGAEDEEEEEEVEGGEPEVAEGAATAAKPEDTDMEGVEAEGKEEDEESEAGSEDIEDDSEDDEEEELEEEEAEAEAEANGEQADHDMEVENGAPKQNGASAHNASPADVMVH